MSPVPGRLLAHVLAGALLVTSCSGGADDVVSSSGAASLDGGTGAPRAPDGDQAGTTLGDAGEAGTTAGDDVECTEEALSGGDEGFTFTSAHRVVDGGLGDVCFGTEDPVLLDAWDALVTITPPGQLTDLALFAGFEPDGDAEADTLAFVNAVDAEGGQFQMTVNVVEAEADPDELLITLAHEFTHVFAATATQLDRTDEAINECETYVNGEGCYLPDALMLAWIDEFWRDALIDPLRPVDDSAEAAEARCAADEGFFGSYAATNPEEDFAEAFSAYVVRLAPDNAAQQQRLDWIDAQPGLAEFRDRADAAGLTPLPNDFDPCG